MSHVSSEDPRVIRTRQFIKQAFVRVLEDTEVQKISVNRIAELATINRVTFYSHYKDIPDMLEKMADEMVANIRNILDNKPLNDYCTTEVETVLACLFEHIAEHASFYRLVLATKQIPIFTERLLALLTEIITTHIEEIEHDMKADVAEVPTDLIVWYFSSALIGTMVAWLQNDMPYSPGFLAKKLSLFIGK